jgi:cytochrome c551/c552
MAEKFMVFNTVSQAKNYAHRQKAYFWQDGCGCCWASLQVFVEDSKVLELYTTSHAGDVQAEMKVIGKVKCGRKG